MTTLALRVRPAYPPLVARGFAFAALCGFGLVHWMLMLDPAQPARAAAALGVALAAAALAMRSLPAGLAAGVLAALFVGGVTPGDLWPAHWGELASSIGDGAGSVGAARIPYAGSDPDLRLVIPLGGTLLAAVSGVLAFRDRRIWSLTALVTLYAVPAVALDLKGEFLRGAVLAVLVLLYLRLERVSQREFGAAAGIAAAAAVIALAAAPALDTRRPWFDYEAFAQDASRSHPTTFHWNHFYASLDFPRDGRQMLRVESPRRAYWKVDDLEVFDGFRWTENSVAGGPPSITDQNLGVTPENLARWTFPISVSVRDLASPTLALAGTPQSVDFTGHRAFPVAAAVWSSTRAIHRADAYTARVYVPSPSKAELEAATPAFYPDPVMQDLTFKGVTDRRPEPFQVLVRTFKDHPFLVSYGAQDAVPSLRDSSLRRMYALSQRLLADADTPYDYVQAIQRHLRRGFVYDELPPRSAHTLDGFLFDARRGFCQHFSGAMALLLRMGGVPARVATGFAPGSYDEAQHRYVVRDLDAHSWVEAWFEGIGWVDFDPTPAAAPPRSQAFGSAASAAAGDIRDRGTTLAAAPVPDPQSSPWAEVAIAVVGLTAIVTLAGLVLLRRRRATITLSELERALLGAGEACGPGTTLTALEQRLPGAAGYLRALRQERYGRGAGPTAADRRDLRRALAAGRGPIARARTFLALPPRLR